MGILRRSRGRAPQASVVDAADTLLANIRFSDVDGEVSSIVVTSASPNEGKSTVAVALASSMARSGSRVLLVECDMHRRTLADRLGVRAAVGLFAVVSGEAALLSAAAPTRSVGLWLLDVEPHIPLPCDVIGSEGFARMLAQAERAFDYVVLDTPPVCVFPDAALAASKADASVMVVREGFACRAEVADAGERLARSGSRVLGAVVNFCGEGM